MISNDVPAKEIPSTLDVAGVSAGDTIDTLPDGITVKAYPAYCKGVCFMVTTKFGMKIFHGGDLSTLQIHRCHNDDTKDITTHRWISKKHSTASLPKTRV